MIKKLIFSFFLFFTGVLGYGQILQSWHLKSTKLFPSTPHTLTEIWRDNTSGAFIRGFRDKKGLKTISEGHYKGMQTEVFEEGIVLEDGKQYSFPNERVLHYNNGNLISSAHINDSKQEFRHYTISSSTPILKNKIFWIPEGSALINTYNNITIVTDEYEGFGGGVNIYSDRLDSINTYTPYGREGFMQSIWGYSQAYSAGIFVPNDTDARAKLCLVDKNGMIVLDKELNMNLSMIQYLKPLERHILVYIRGALMVYDLNGNLLWQREMNISDNVAIQSSLIAADEATNTVFVVAENDKIISMQLNSGAINWQKDVSQIYNIPLLNIMPEGQILKKRVLSLAAIPSGFLAIVAGQTINGYSGSEISKYENYTYVLGSKGELLLSNKMSDEVKLITIFPSSAFFAIATEKNILTYEKTP